MVGSFSVRMFEEKYKVEQDVRAKQRLLVLLLRRKKYTQKQISDIVCVSQGTVSNVCRRFDKGKWVSVYDKPRPGRASGLSEKQKTRIKKALSHELVEGDVHRGWQTKDVMSLLKEEFGVVYSQRHVERLLHELGMSWKVPRPEHRNRDEAAVKSFKKTSRGRHCLWHVNTVSSA